LKWNVNQPLKHLLSFAALRPRLGFGKGVFHGDVIRFIGIYVVGGIAFLPAVEPPLTEEEEFEPYRPELEESAPPTDGPDLLWGGLLDDKIDGRAVMIRAMVTMGMTR
jgi:hypothetical protein